LESQLKACEEAIAHLRVIIAETNNRLTLLALHVQPDSPVLMAPWSAAQDAPATPACDPNPR